MAKQSKSHNTKAKIVLGKRKKLKGKRLKFYHENGGTSKSKRSKLMPQRKK